MATNDKNIHEDAENRKEIELLKNKVKELTLKTQRPKMRNKQTQASFPPLNKWVKNAFLKNNNKQTSPNTETDEANHHNSSIPNTRPARHQLPNQPRFHQAELNNRERGGFRANYQPQRSPHPHYSGQLPQQRRLNASANYREILNPVSHPSLTQEMRMQLSQGYIPWNLPLGLESSFQQQKKKSFGVKKDLQKKSPDDGAFVLADPSKYNLLVNYVQIYIEIGIKNCMAVALMINHDI